MVLALSQRDDAPAESAESPGAGLPSIRVPGAIKPARSDLIEEPVLGTYKVLGRIGERAGTELLRAEQLRAAAAPLPCVIKRLSQRDGRDPSARQRLLREGHVNLSFRHPNLVEVYDYGTIDGWVCIVRELVDGVSLHALRSAPGTGKLPLEVVAVLGRKIAEVLALAHELRDEEGSPFPLMHGALSPAEMLIGRNGAVKVTELRMPAADAPAIRLPSERHRWRRGYMPPEQVERRFVDARSDIFSLGITLAEIIATRPLVSDGPVRWEELHALIRQHLGNRRGVPPELTALILRMTAIDANERPGHAREVAEALDSFIAPVGLRSEVEARAVESLAHGVEIAIAQKRGARAGRKPACEADRQRGLEVEPRAKTLQPKPVPPRADPSERFGRPTLAPPPRAVTPAHVPVAPLVAGVPPPRHGSAISGAMTPPPAPVPATSPASFMREPDLAELLGGPIPASVTAIPLRPSRVPPPRRASLPMAIDAPDLAYLAGPAEPAVPFPPPPPPSPRQPPAPAPLGLKPAPAIRPLTVPAWSNQGPMSRRPSVSPAPRAMSAMASSMSPPLTHVDGTGFVPTTPTVVVSREQLDHIRQLSANLRRRAQLERVRNLVGVLILLALCWYIWDWYQMQ